MEEHPAENRKVAGSKPANPTGSVAQLARALVLRRLRVQIPPDPLEVDGVASRNNTLKSLARAGIKRA